MFYEEDLARENPGILANPCNMICIKKNAKLFGNGTGRRDEALPDI